jgi:ATP-dependent exoDNAse (exonuclease V) beta subunit
MELAETRESNPSTLGKRTFLGWDRPVLESVIDQLWKNYARDQVWDMRRLYVVLPSALAKRRLSELLVLRAQQEQAVLYAPPIVTIGMLPEHLYVAKRPFASDLVQALTWMSVLKSTPQSDLEQIIPHPPENNASQQWLELGKLLSNLHQELSSDRLSFEDVANALGRNHIESNRWQALQQLQKQYLKQIHELGLWDIQTARLEALGRGEAKASGTIIVIGCVDLNRAQRGFLEAINQQVQIWIAAPASYSNHFDPWGCLDGDSWQSATVDIPTDSLLVGNAPADQAELVAASLAELGDKYHTRQVTLGVPDAELIPELQHHLDLCGVTARFGPGKPLSQSEPAKLLALVGRYIEGQTYGDFAALIRHPAIENLLRSQKAKLPDDWLSQLDKYYQEALPKVIDSFVNEALPQATVYRAVTAAINRWLSKLGRRWMPVSHWVQPLLNVLMTAYDKIQCDLGDESESQLFQASSLICESIVSLRDIPPDVEPKMTITELIDWLLRNASNQLLPEPPSQTAIEMLGWLELALDDAPALVIAGIHDGVIPESVSADAFLPNQLRRQLGMMDNSRRYARDMYSLHVMLASREHLKIVVGKSNAVGDPLVPSRLLLACPLAQLPARVLHLVQEDRADVLPAVARRWKPTKGGSKLVVPRPLDVKPPRTITVTAFRDYLRCPYRYYLRHVLKLRDDQDADIELDAPKFGVLVHGALDKFGQSPVARSTNAEEICDFLIAELLKIASAQFGPNPPANVLIQIEQAQSRLEAFAVKQAQRADEGWEIRFTEMGSTIDTGLKIGNDSELFLIGRIDRIDYHPDTKQWAIWDYKTSESAKHPEAVHWNARDKWCDLQLPLYVPIARSLGVTGTPILGYIGLPKLARDIDFYVADFDEARIKEALAVADEVASKVAACEFWPEAIKSVDYDDYARICQSEVQRVEVAAPARKLHRTTGYDGQLISQATVQAATQRLNNTLVRTPIKLPPLLIRASAGTGKTFQLSNRLLHILLSGQDVDPILATTFTRKAAGEIMQRVLQRLALGCIDQSKRDELAEHLPGVDVSADACLATLRRVTASIHRLRVSTLDSFFAQVARTFSLDMGLPSGWSSMDPVREPQAQMQAISDLLDNHERKTLIDLIRMLAKGESTRKVSDEIRNTVTQGYAIYRSTTAEAWDQLPLPKPPSESAVESAILTLAQTRMNHKSIDAELEKLHLLARIGDWEEIVQHGIYKRLNESPPTYYRKELPGNLVVALELLVDRAAAELLPIRRSQTIASYDVLKAYDESYTSLIRRQRMLAFSDVSYFLSQWMLGGKLTGKGAQSLAQLEYRMDCGIQHLLLDEFQDTSLEQWDILRPLAKPLGGPASGDRSFFCVGDTKQAIYGWRGGVAEIFDSVTKSIDGLETSDLRDSFRSSPEIMEVVNRVFENLDKHSNYSNCDALAHRWSELFPQHRTSRKDLPGYVQLINGPKQVADELTADEKRFAYLQFSADRIAELSRKTSASIGVLFRTNADVARMIALLRDRGVSASQGSGNPLTDSAAVELILSLVHLADHPGDGTCAFHVQSSPLAFAIPADVRNRPAAISNWFRQRVTRFGLGKTIEAMADQLANQLSWWDQQRLQQLIRSAHAFEATGGRLREFEESVERDRVALPTEAQVKVMTIHGSKGLEYDAVFLPELDGDLTKSNSMLVTRRDDPCEPPNGVLRYMNASLQSMLPASWQRAFEASKAGSLFETLCVLYVAMTRARCALYMITHPAGKSSRQDYSSLLHSTLADKSDKAKIAEEMVELLSLGNPQWYEALAQQRASRQPNNLQLEEKAGPQSELQIQLPNQPSNSRGSLREPTLDRGAIHDFDQSLLQRPEFVALSEAFSVSHSVGAAHESLIHALFGQVEWLDSFTADRDSMRRIAFATLQPEELRHLSLDDVLDEFLTLLDLSSVKAAFSRSRYHREIMGRVAERVEVDSHRPVSAMVDGTLIEGHIDRMAVLYKDGKPYAAEIFNLKVDAFDPKMTLLWLDDRVDYHRPQMALFAQIVAQQLQIPRSQVASYLLMLSTDDIVRLDQASVAAPKMHSAWPTNSTQIQSGR